MPRIAVALVCAVASPVAAEDTKPAIAVMGYLETYYSLNLRLPSNRITNLRAFDNRERSLTLSNVALGVTGTRGALTTRIVLQVGSTPATYYLAEPTLAGTASVNASDASLWRHVQQATVAYAGPGALVLDAGLFPSPIGPEVIPVKDNWNWSRSNLFFGLPFYHTGVRAAHPLGGGWSAMLHVYSGWNSVVDSNETPSVAVSASYTSARVTAQLLYFGGVERPAGAPEGAAWRNLFDAYATVAITDQTSVQVQLDGGFEPNTLGRSAWVAGALYAKVQLSSWLYAAARADYFREWIASTDGVDASAIFWPTPWMASGTATLAASPSEGISVRLEIRHDHAKTPVFFGGEVAGDGAAMPFVPDRRAQDTVTLGATAWF